MIKMKQRKTKFKKWIRAKVKRMRHFKNEI